MGVFPLLELPLEILERIGKIVLLEDIVSFINTCTKLHNLAVYRPFMELYHVTSSRKIQVIMKSPWKEIIHNTKIRWTPLTRTDTLAFMVQDKGFKFFYNNLKYFLDRIWIGSRPDDVEQFERDLSKISTNLINARDPLKFSDLKLLIKSDNTTPRKILFIESKRILWSELTQENLIELCKYLKEENIGGSAIILESVLTNLNFSIAKNNNNFDNFFVALDKIKCEENLRLIFEKKLSLK
ncbi:hypothetical protein HDU92_004432 [Lobulomyces angularis]|nr:hypothetical protein HDU92_004432 [Lobulomyces angularis]